MKYYLNLSNFNVRTFQNPVLKFESKLWNLLMEPLLFGLVGTEIDLTITDISEVFAAIGIFLIIILVSKFMYYYTHIRGQVPKLLKFMEF